MSKSIDVHPGTLQWRFYCLRFTLDGLEVESPRNLCRYFWISVHGFGMWLSREAKLLMLWLVAMAATALLLAVVRVLPKSYVLTQAVFWVITPLWYLVLLVALFATVTRAQRIIDARIPWAKNLIVGSIFSTFVIYAVSHVGLSTLLRQLYEEAKGAMKLAAIMVAAMIVLGIILIIVPQTWLQRVSCFFRALSARASAGKRSACPQVNPPPGFTEQ